MERLALTLRTNIYFYSKHVYCQLMYQVLLAGPVWGGNVFLSHGWRSIFSAKAQNLLKVGRRLVVVRLQRARASRWSTLYTGYRLVPADAEIHSIPSLVAYRHNSGYILCFLVEVEGTFHGRLLTSMEASMEAVELFREISYGSISVSFSSLNVKSHESGVSLKLEACK